MSGDRTARALALGLGVVLVGWCAAVALASTRTITDAQDVKCYRSTDSSGRHYRLVDCRTLPGRKPADIKSVTVKTGGGRRGDQIQFTITTFGNSIYGLSSRNPFPAVQAFMPVGHHNYITGSMGHGVQIIDLRNGRTSGNVTFKRVNGHTEVLTFSKQAVGSPGTFKWRVTDPGCESCGPVNDLAPNSGFVSQHT